MFLSCPELVERRKAAISPVSKGTGNCYIIFSSIYEKLPVMEVGRVVQAVSVTCSTAEGSRASLRFAIGIATAAEGPLGLRHNDPRLAQDIDFPLADKLAGDAGQAGLGRFDLRHPRRTQALHLVDDLLGHAVG